MRRKIVFITGTRADFGKLKPLMFAVEKDVNYECYIFVSGMHLLEIHGNTYEEVVKCGFKNVHISKDINYTNNMALNLGETIEKFTRYLLEIKPDLVVVHGDRIDALAATTSGALNNIKVAHIEGGEVSGTIDESIRHSISKFAHVHYTCNATATKRLTQMGENPKYIYEIGSPDIDIMLSDKLPSLNDVMLRYDIPFIEYGILMYHPVTTEIDKLEQNIQEIVKAIVSSKRNYVVIYPNNDLGADIIIKEYAKLHGNKKIRVFPSVRFEFFLTLLKNSQFILGNSSAGIREAGVYGIPAIDIGNRQHGRYSCTIDRNIQHIPEEESQILKAIGEADKFRIFSNAFGKGHSRELFIKSLQKGDIWNMNIQKNFIDLI